MNLKVAYLVVVQFGMFIGIVICLAFFRFELSKPRTAAEMRKPAIQRAAAVERMTEPEDESADMADNREMREPAEPLTEQPAPALPTQYSPEAVEKSMAILTKLYYEQIAPRRTASSNPPNTAVAPSSAEVAQEPQVVQYDDPAPQTVAYVQPPQFVVYPQPIQFVVFSQPRRFDSRCRPAAHPSGLGSNSHRRWDNGGTHLNGLPESRPARPLGPQQRRTGVPTCPSTEGFPSRGKR